MNAPSAPGVSEHDAILRTVRLHPYELDLLADALEAEAAKAMRAGQGELHDLMMCRAVWFRKALEQ